MSSGWSESARLVGLEGAPLWGVARVDMWCAELLVYANATLTMSLRPDAPLSEGSYFSASLSAENSFI